MCWCSQMLLAFAKFADFVKLCHTVNIKSRASRGRGGGGRGVAAVLINGGGGLGGFRSAAE